MLNPHKIIWISLKNKTLNSLFSLGGSWQTDISHLCQIKIIKRVHCLFIKTSFCIISNFFIVTIHIVEHYSVIICVEYILCLNDMDYVDIQAVESKLTDVTVTPIPMGTKLSSAGHGNVNNSNNYANHHHQNQNQQQQQYQLQPQNLTTTSVVAAAASPTPTHSASALVTPVTSLNHFPNNSNLSKYAQLLMVIEEMGRDIRPTYSGSRSSAERLKRGIVHARILVRECLLETERSARQ